MSMVGSCKLLCNTRRENGGPVTDMKLGVGERLKIFGTEHCLEYKIGVEN